MPFVNLKLVKGQTTPEQRQALIEGLTDLIVTVLTSLIPTVEVLTEYR